MTLPAAPFDAAQASLQPVPASRPNDPAADAVKGVLILLIALGHDPAAAVALPWLGRFLYGFHVIGFLLLPFLLPAPRAEARALLDRSVRYLAPYASVTLFAIVLNTLLFARDVPARELFERAALGLYTGSSGYLKITSGFALFWFLPTLLSLTLVRAALRGRGTPRAWLVVLVALHGTLALVPDFAAVLPLGLAPALVALPLGLAAEKAWPWARTHPLAMVAIAVAVAVPVLASGISTNLAALAVADVRDPLRLLLQDAHAITMFLAIAACGPHLARVPGLVRLGQLSMGVYLGHSFVLQALMWGSMRLGLDPIGRHAAILALPLLVLSTAGGIACALVLNRQPLRRWILPRGLKEWPPTAIRP